MKKEIINIISSYPHQARLGKICDINGMLFKWKYKGKKSIYVELVKEKRVEDANLENIINHKV